MNKLIYGLIVLSTLWGCKQNTQNFTFKIKGTINGQESGQIYFMESNRVGDEVSIPIINGTFDYQGESSYMYSSMVLIDIYGEKGVFQFVVEPGEIILELETDSFTQKSQVLSGKYNIAYQNAYSEFYNLFSNADFDSDDVKNKITSWLITNNENLMSMTLLNSVCKKTHDISELLKKYDLNTPDIFRVIDQFYFSGIFQPYFTTLKYKTS